MSLLRRKVLLLSLGAAAWPVVPRSAPLESSVPRPIHIVVGFPPGGIADLSARLIGQSLQQRLGQSVVVEKWAKAIKFFGAKVD